jgi:hypothetical protein
MSGINRVGEKAPATIRKLVCVGKGTVTAIAHPAHNR